MEENRGANVSGTESGSPRQHAITSNSQLPRENNNFNLGPREQEMIETHLELLRLQSNRAQVGHTHIGNRQVWRGYGVAGSIRASRTSNQYVPMNQSREQYFPRFGLSFNPNGSSATMLPNGTLDHGVRAGMSRLASGNNSGFARQAGVPYASQRGMTTFGEFAYEAPMNLSREQNFPRFGLSFNPNGSSTTMLPNGTLYHGVRAGMSRLASGNNSGLARQAGVPYASQRDMPTFGEFAYEANPWLRYTDRYRETIAESNRNHAAMQALLAIAEHQRNNAPIELRRNNPYNPHNHFPAQNPWNNVAAHANSEESGIHPRNNEASQEESVEVGSGDENMVELEVQSQNHDASLIQQIVADESTTRCMFCLMEVPPNPSHRRRCGHYFHFQCLIVYPDIIECCICEARASSQGN